MEDDRRHVYTLRYDDGVTETIHAHLPSEAVAARTRRLMPAQITDTTLMERWCARAPRNTARRLTEVEDPS